MKLDYAIIDAIDSICIYWKDLEGRVVGCNKSLCRIAGVASREEIIGKTDFELPWRSEAVKIRELDHAVVSNNRSYRMHETIIMDDGSVSIFLTTKTPLVKNNKIVGVVGVSIDITEQKQLEAELIAKHKEIEWIRNNNNNLQDL